MINAIGRCSLLYVQHAFMIFPFNCGIFLCLLHSFHSLYSNGISHNNDINCPTLKRACRREKTLMIHVHVFPFNCGIFVPTAWLKQLILLQFQDVLYQRNIFFIRLTSTAPTYSNVRAHSNTHTHIHTYAHNIHTNNYLFMCIYLCIKRIVTLIDEMVKQTQF